MYADDNELMTLPQLSTVEKLDRMSQKFGSKTSLMSSSSIEKPAVSPFGSANNVRKGID